MKTFNTVTFAVVATLLASTAHGLSIVRVPHRDPRCRDVQLGLWPTPMKGLAAFVGADMNALGTAGCAQAKQLLETTFGIGCDTNLGTGAVRALLNVRGGTFKRRRMFEFWKEETWTNAGKDIGDAFAKTPKDLDNMGKDAGKFIEGVGKGFDKVGKDIKDTFVGVGEDIKDAVVGAVLPSIPGVPGVDLAKQLDQFFTRAGADFEKAIAQLALDHTLTARDFEREFAKIGRDFESIFGSIGRDFDAASKDFKALMERFGRQFERAIADILKGAGDINGDAMAALLAKLTGKLADVCPATCAAPGSYCAPATPVFPPAPVKFCCQALTAECESCKADVSVEAFCRRRPHFAGCPPVVPTCKNAYVCPAHSFRRKNRKCYDSIHDCACEHGYRMNKHAERCELIPVNPVAKPEPTPVARPDTTKPSKPTVVVVVNQPKPQPPVKPDPTDAVPAKKPAAPGPSSSSSSTVPIVIGVVAGLAVVVAGIVAYKRVQRKRAANPAAGTEVHEASDSEIVVCYKV